jgi:KaiC/GvpD/RAD55 family RecA-like ATPase
MRLAYLCAEMKMSDEEAYAILANADERWKKFKGRTDQTKRLLDLINRARHKYPIDPEIIVDELPIYSWKQLLDLEIHVDWMIEGKLQRQGIMIVAGAPGAGKTQIVMQALMHIAMGKNFLDWKIETPRPVCFFSMEMGPADLKYIMGQMDAILTDEQKALLEQNFSLVPIGQGIMFESATDRKKIENVLRLKKPECVVFDSLSTTTMDELSEERTAKRVMDVASQMRNEFDCSIIFIHHNRKAQVNNKKPNGLSDVYGSNFITAQATSVLGVWRNLRTNEIELSWLKVRLAKEPDEMSIIRVEGLMFEEVSPTGLLKQAEESREEAIRDKAKREEPTPGRDGIFGM